jgi:hypothetical protein
MWRVQRFSVPQKRRARARGFKSMERDGRSCGRSLQLGKATRVEKITGGKAAGFWEATRTACRSYEATYALCRRTVTPHQKQELVY